MVARHGIDREEVVRPHGMDLHRGAACGDPERTIQVPVDHTRRCVWQGDCGSLNGADESQVRWRSRFVTLHLMMA